MKTTVELSQSLDLPNIIPLHMQENNPGFVSFLEAYYDWMEQNGNVNNVIHKFGMLHESVNYFADRTSTDDVKFDQFAKDLYELYAQEYTRSYPSKTAVREDLFIHSIREVLLTKGSIPSIVNFFRTVYGTDATVKFPDERRLTYNARTQYVVRTDILIDDEFLNAKLEVLKLARGRYFYSTFGSIGKLVGIDDSRISSGRKIVELTFHDVNPGTFIIGDKIAYQFTPEEISYFSNGVDLSQEFGLNSERVFYGNSVISVQLSGIITDYDIVQSGLGYRKGELISLSTGSELRSGSAIIREVNADGGILSIRITDPGYEFDAYMRVDDRQVPDYTGSVYGGKIISSGYGAIINFTAGASSFWNSADTIISGSQVLEYSVGNTIVSGKELTVTNGEYFLKTNLLDPSDILPYYSVDESGSYFISVANSYNPADYKKTSVSSVDKKSFGKLYFEMQWTDDSAQFTLPPGETFDFEGSFDSGEYTVGLIGNEIESSQDFQVGGQSGSWGVQLLRDRIVFWNEGTTTTHDISIPAIEGKRTLRFLVDLINDVCFVGYSGGWIGPEGVMTETPEQPVFELNYTDSIQFAASGRFIPQINLLCATRASQILYSIPDRRSVPDGDSSQSYIVDYDVYDVRILPWDTSSVTLVNDSDIYKLVSEDVTYKYKILTDIPPRVWSKVYKACVHPSGIQYQSVFGGTITSISEGENSMEVSTPTEISHSKIECFYQEETDLSDNRNNTFTDVIEFTPGIANFGDAPVYWLDKGVGVNAIETELKFVTPQPEPQGVVISVLYGDLFYN